MSCVYSSFSSFRCTVASAAALSSSAIPACRDLSSSASCAIAPLRSSIEVSRSPASLAKSLTLSSAASICLSQYSFLDSSSTCSWARRASMSSTILMTLEKSTLRPPSMNSTKRTFKRPPGCSPWRPWSAESARCRACSAPCANCTKLALGSVFLKSSRASSSLRIVMVSEMASSSSERICALISHSSFFVWQFCCRSAWKRWSSSRASSVSVRSSFICTSCTARLPARRILSSMDLLKASTSFFLAAMSSS
mmetsp:Transcript_2051/g.6109  ORF Transcript_2051/g.6109 Transcript_2051/m.6109 type:complete len:252 (-) Transcript_2051:535-1290(-)